MAPLSLLAGTTVHAYPAEVWQIILRHSVHVNIPSMLKISLVPPVSLALSKRRTIQGGGLIHIPKYTPTKQSNAQPLVNLKNCPRKRLENRGMSCNYVSRYKNTRSKFFFSHSVIIFRAIKEYQLVYSAKSKYDTMRNTTYVGIHIWLLISRCLGISFYIWPI